MNNLINAHALKLERALLCEKKQHGKEGKKCKTVKTFQLKLKLEKQLQLTAKLRSKQLPYSETNLVFSQPQYFWHVHTPRFSIDVLATFHYQVFQINYDYAHASCCMSTHANLPMHKYIVSGLL